MLAESEPTGQLQRELLPAGPVRPVVSYPDDSVRSHHRRRLAQMASSQLCVLPAPDRL